MSKDQTTNPSYSDTQSCTDTLRSLSICEVSTTSLGNTDGRGQTLGLCFEHVRKAIIKGFKSMAEMEKLSLNHFCGILSGKIKKLWNIKLDSSGKLFLERDGLVHLDTLQLCKHPIIWLATSESL